MLSGDRSLRVMPGDRLILSAKKRKIMNRRSLPHSLALLTPSLATRVLFAAEPPDPSHCTPQGHDALGKRFRAAIAAERFDEASKYLQIAANCEIRRLQTTSGAP